MRSWWVLPGAAALAMLLPATARAGSVHFPDTFAIFAPVDRPDEILLTANIGLLRSEDGGKTWTWACAQQGADQAPAYVLGAAPRDRLFALGNTLSYSDDGGCSWQAAGGLAATVGVGRVVVDPTSADRVLAIGGFANDAGESTYVLLESTDGGATFGSVRYSVRGVGITGVAVAPTNPRQLYLTLSTGTSLLWSADDGSSWTAIDLSSALGDGWLRVLAVDAFDNGKVFLQHSTQRDQGLVVRASAFSGTTVTRPIAVPFPGSINGFLQTAGGTLLISASGGAFAATPVLFRSVDGGATFTQVAGPPHIRQMAERNGVIYAATFEGDDGFSEATSVDDGVTWQAGMSLTKVQAITGCAKAACQEICNFWATDELLWPQAVCSADLPDAGTDAGIDAGTDAGRDTGARVPQDAASDGAHAMLVRRGCRCGTGNDGGESAWAATTVVLLGLPWLRRRVSRRRRDAGAVPSVTPPGELAARR